MRTRKGCLPLHRLGMTQIYGKTRIANHSFTCYVSSLDPVAWVNGDVDIIRRTFDNKFGLLGLD
jgi:hypothetical protein